MPISSDSNLTDDTLLERYSRHILLPEIGIAGQQALSTAHALIIGLGGLGSPAAMYLASSGIGKLTVADSDRVELSNLQRQILHDSRDIGRPKTASAQDSLIELNPNCRIKTINQSLLGRELTEAVREADIILDASDNFETRFAVNQACVENSRPLVCGAVIRFEGQLSLFHTSESQACYRCLYPEHTAPDAGNCSDSGVLAPLTGVIGSLMACEAIKWLTGAGDCLQGQLLTINVLNMKWKIIKLRKDPACPVCSAIGEPSRLASGS